MDQSYAFWTFFALSKPLCFDTNFTLPDLPSPLNTSCAAFNAEALNLECKLEIPSDLKKKKKMPGTPPPTSFLIGLVCYAAWEVAFVRFSRWLQCAARQEPIVSTGPCTSLAEERLCGNSPIFHPLPWALYHSSFLPRNYQSWRLGSYIYLCLYLTVCSPGYTSGFSLKWWHLQVWQ